MATGTGSGKTECFLLPLLEHCRLQHARGQRGIKAILIDPMNALATDQARRIADLIHTIPALAGLRAGLYIGASGDDATAAMTATSVITDKEALHKAPPDILLTNYKQLDYLLIQPHVQGLWLLFADNEVGRRSATSSLAGWVSAGDPGADAQGPGDAGTADKSPTQSVHAQTTSRQQPGGGGCGGGHLGTQCPPD